MDLDGEIGFATLPEQVHRKSVKKGFDFTLIVVGETGLGKSTLINSLFLTDLYKDRKILSVEEKVDRIVEIEKTTMDIEEKGVKLRLTIVDTPGFSDAINCEDNWKTIERYIDDQFNQFFKDESGLNRKNIVDNRVHCCLYFISPYGHGLRQMDVEFMKRLHMKVNIVPVIAKADTLTPAEVRRLKDRILREVEENEIKIYQLPECDSDEDEEFKQQDRELKESVPFAVIGSTQVVEINGRKVRGRLYPWGIVEVENPKHSDFLKLRTFLISTHMQDLKDVTRDVHYENYRAQYITKISQQAARERNKLRRDSGPNFEAVSETDRLLQQKEEEIRKMQEMLQQMQQKLKVAGTDDAPKGEIGFATLPEQVHRKSVKKGFDFTLIVVGETGLGKSTLINSLFLTDLYKDRKILSVEEKVDRIVEIEKTTMDIEEKGVKLRLTIVDTPGFSDAINCEDNWKTIERYIDDQFNQFFKDESGLNRKNIVDNRVHCCLYFISPYGHGLRQMDVEFMKRLHMKVNIVPVIAKADTLTPAEVRRLKDRILREVEENEIKIYQLPECDSDEDEEFKQQDRELKESVPFAVIGSTQVVEINGRKVRGRLYPWGIVEVENPKHSDFLKLRTFLISTHMQDLKDVTRDVHYENYRAQYITKISQQAARERNKLRRDSGPNFEAVSETDRLLQQKEEEIRKMQEMLQQMQQKLKVAGTDDAPKEDGSKMNF